MYIHYISNHFIVSQSNVIHIHTDVVVLNNGLEGIIIYHILFLKDEESLMHSPREVSIKQYDNYFRRNY